MPKIHCCLCSRRTDTNKQRVRVGADHNWELLKIHVEKNGLDLGAFSREDYVCKKCNTLLAHHGMKDRGPNKTIKNGAPVTYEQGIKKSSLRSRNKLLNSQSDSHSVMSPEADKPSDSSNSVDSNGSNFTTSKKAQKSKSPKTALQLASNHVQAGSNDTADDNNNDAPVGPDVNEPTEVQPPDNVAISSVVPFSSVRSTDNLNSIEPKKCQQSKIRDSPSQSVNTSAVNEITPPIELDSPGVEPFVDIAGTVTGTYQNKTVIPNDEGLLSLVSTTTEPKITELDQANKVSSSVADSMLHMKGVKATQSRCFICQSKSGRKVVPWQAIRQTWFKLRCYVPKTNRTCDEHLTHSHAFNGEAVTTIMNLMQDISLEVKEFQSWLNVVSDLPDSTPYNFDVDGVEPEKYKMFLGIEKESFDDLLQYLKGMRNTSTRSLRNALAMFLLLLRNNMKQEIIAYNFSTTQQAVSKTIDAVSLALEEHFVPQHLGYHHITREEALEKHSIKLTSKVLGQPESKLCVIADDTYNYIEKPSDFILQRKTFSAHKKRNLLKPLYIVFPDGYILEAAGPYFCDAKNNDAANIRHHYSNSDLLLFLEEEDYFLLDRGYRDVIDETVEKGFSVYMPSLLTGKRTNFDCDEANSSRMVTMFRWVVEAVNGRIKNVFPFFKHTIEGTYVPKIMRFNRIACAISNKYFPPLVVNKAFHGVISEVCEGEVPKTNELKDEIEKLGLKRMTTRWEKASASSITGFPKLSMDDLHRITLGSYQIKIAERYIDTHLKEDNDFGIFIHREMEGVVRARIQSRFRNSKSHDAWVKFKENEAGYDAIKGWYCTCKVGERTLGCCSHLTSVLRYLGFDRHQPSKEKVRSRCAWDAIDCADLSGSGSESESEV